jgi:hypothetical protein
MKSSLKTFLAGKNPYIEKDKKGNACVKLKASTWLTFATDDADVLFHNIFSTPGTDDLLWNIDVLDDGTAITYSIGS